MTGEQPDWRTLFEEQMWRQRNWLQFDADLVLSPSKRLGTIWLWTVGFIAECVSLAPHPFSWMWGFVAMELWVIAIAGMAYFNQRTKDK